jgi:phosphatidylserine/phosphatidylglycerophosphate/cardiolipin synthase-like enzyme
MNPDELNRFLSRSLADRKLSGGEKSALADWLAANVTTDQHRGLVRHAAFEVARQAIADPASAEVVEWLEDVMKVIAPLASGGREAPVLEVGPPSRGGRDCGEGEQHEMGSSAARLAAPIRQEQGQAFFSPGEACLQQIVHRFHACRRTADVCVYTITDDRISRSILDAHRRRVAVRLITDAEKQYDLGSDIQRFREAGIAVKFGELLGEGGHMHHKFAVFDAERLVCGSYNWTRGAANINFEDLIDTGDAELVAAFSAEFARLWNRF